jgi:glyoxylase-like metal-dependent hydrolase (beta-lactamase superfamily II)
MHLTSPRSAFKATRLSKSTFIVKELNDIYDEHPLIYIKVIPEANTVVCIDTGCGGASKDPDVEITSLRQFLETVPVPDNEYRPLNDNGMEYIVITTHVHFDHIRTYESRLTD